MQQGIASFAISNDEVGRQLHARPFTCSLHLHSHPSLQMRLREVNLQGQICLGGGHRTQNSLTRDCTLNLSATEAKNHVIQRVIQTNAENLRF